ncbi:tyrosine-type recombinase/integrase [Massilia sp. CCM 9210]|uniref:tyrosine-type recombinase/integrase n=3 Tax=Massilia TaxID=149698 RepID=UPI00279641D6|nr:site-specific integrase [Massilia sp. CCM 9210]MDQ1817325.1 tyrosine-type recombinase/integrase [Massilia sp. CCM 9210]
MSSTLFKVGKYYHYRFRLAGGARRQRTTHEVNHKRAHAIMSKAYADAVLLASGMQLVPTLEELIEQWEQLRAPIASKSHRRGIDVFKRRHLHGLGQLLISDLGTEIIEKARNAHLATRKPATANHWLRKLKLLVNWAVKRKIISKLPWDVPMLPVQKIPRATLPTNTTDDWLAEIDKATTRSPSVAIAVRLMYGLGLRESEAASACWEWIDWERRTFTPGITKGKEAVPVPMPRWLVAYLAPQRRPQGLIAPGKQGRALPDGFARYAMRRANAATSLTGITPHRLRGTCATLMSEEGTPIQTIQAIMRHKDPKTTMGYLEVNMDVASRAQDRIEDKIYSGRKMGDARQTGPSGA